MNVLFRFVLMGMMASVAFLITDSVVHHRYHTKKPHRFDRAAEADRFYYEQRTYPFGSAPPDWRVRAAEHVERMEMQSMKKKADWWKWVSLGPNNVAGRIRAMAMDPRDPKVLYAGAAGGGVWKSTNGGASWRALSDFISNLRIGSIAVHPNDPNLIFAGSGEGFVYWQDALAYGRGIYQSNDAGETWFLNASTDNQNFEFVFDIRFDPFWQNVVLASTRRGIMRSSDFGATWTRVIAGARGMMTAFSKTTDGLVYAALESSGIYRSSDHGITWTRIMNGIATTMEYTRIQIAAAPSNGDIVYAAFTDYYDESCAGMYRTTDRGESWKGIAVPMNEIDGNTYMGQQGQYNSVLTVHPTNPGIIWAGGIDLYRSTNSGTNWKQMTNWYQHASFTFVHADQHELLFNPQNPNEMFAACDGGVFRTTNGGAVFLDANTGLITTQFHSGTPHPTSDNVLGGTIDNGTLKTATGVQWSMPLGGDGGYTAIDYNDTRYMYAELYYLWFHKSSAYGAGGSFVPKMSGIPREPEGWTSDQSAFIAPFEMDPNDPKKLYAGTYRVYRTTNSAELWTPISPNVTGTGGYITAIGISKSNGSVIYTGSSSGSVYVTTNNGTEWTRVSTGLPQRYITDIAVHYADPAIAYVTFSGFGTPHVFRTTDYGTSWVSVSGSGSLSLPDVPTNSIVINPANPQRLYVGTDVGVFFSYDGGVSWEVNNEGMGNVTVADLQFRKDGTLFASTHGRGVFKTSFSLLDSQRTPIAESFRLEQNFPNPFSSQGQTTIAYTIERQMDVTLDVFDHGGKLVHRQRLGAVQPGKYYHAFEAGGLSAGVYFYRMNVDGTPSKTMKMIIVK